MTTPAAAPPAALSEIARTVLKKRYLIKDEQGKVTETPETMFRRVAETIAQIDARYGATPSQVKARADTFYHMMTQGLFEPNSPTLMNAGRPLGMLSACFVLPVDDSLESIYETMKHAALVHQSGGGTGFSFSRLRPHNDIVRSTMGVASGPVSFMEVYNYSTEAIKQGGTRRGANMGILRCDHPDILHFISVKQDLSRVTNFNISVAVTDAFMRAVANDEEYDLLNPRTGQVQLAVREALKHPFTGEVLVEANQPMRLRARVVFDLIIQCAHATGEPGLFFVDRTNEGNPVPALGEYEATNPLSLAA
nr:ribonucleotide reductase N-terminal alpha domain-containing protein [Candidatus Oscillochloris fontis]